MLAFHCSFSLWQSTLEWQQQQQQQQQQQVCVLSVVCVCFLIILILILIIILILIPILILILIPVSKLTTLEQLQTPTLLTHPQEPQMATAAIPPSPSTLAPTPAGAIAPKSNPWGAMKKPSAPAVSLKDIQRQEQCTADATFAAKLQRKEERAAGFHTQEDEDATLAAALQEEESAKALTQSTLATSTSTSTPTSTATATAAPPQHTLYDDAALAAALQAEFDAEHDSYVTAEERRANLFGSRCVHHAHVFAPRICVRMHKYSTSIR